MPKLSDPFNEDTDGVDTSVITPQAELLRWYYRITHLFQATITNYQSPDHPISYPLHIPFQVCIMYVWCAMTKKNWQIKEAANRGRVHPSTKPGEFVSVDQLESTTPVFLLNSKEN